MIQDNHLFESFRKLKVLIVGDVMIDRYLTGQVSRISPEAPVPVVHLQQSDNRLGGAANVALNVKALGANAYLASVIGDDDDGRIFLDLLPAQQLSAAGMLCSNERKTTVKTRVIAASQHLLRVDSEDIRDLSAWEEKEYLSRIIDLLEHTDIHVILFQDYNKGVLSPSVIRNIIQEARKRSIPTAVDPKFENFWAYEGVTLFKPNLKEIRSQSSFSVDPDIDSLRQAAGLIRSRLKNTYTMITLSEKGLFLDDQGQSFLFPTQPRSIADVCGAGDTVISVAAVGLASGLPMKEVAMLANLAGGQVCEHVGVAPVNSFQLAQEYQALKI